MEISFSPEVSDAIGDDLPIVALESTVIAHGLPYPHNLQTALELEKTVLGVGAIPATIAVFEGVCHVGLSNDQIEQLATRKDIRKISRRDLAVAAGKRLDCATTVATTTFFAHRAGIKVFATGGIGGVHRGYSQDISADLPELARTPITVVSSGAKIVLDLPGTREWLETFGVTVLGWQCGEMPAFYSRSSGLAIDGRVDNASEAAAIIRGRDALELTSSVLVTVPVPEQYELPRDEMESILADALRDADAKGIRGKEVTPFLLSEMSRRSEGKTLIANIELLKNNARVAAEIAIELAANRK